jgi:hypothetical protein
MIFYPSDQELERYADDSSPNLGNDSPHYCMQCGEIPEADTRIWQDGEPFCNDECLGKYFFEPTEEQPHNLQRLEDADFV